MTEFRGEKQEEAIFQLVKPIPVEMLSGMLNGIGQGSVTSGNTNLGVESLESCLRMGQWGIETRVPQHIKVGTKERDPVSEARLNVRQEKQCT